MHNFQTNLMNYQNSYNLPQELIIKPLALIGFSGLDTINNAVHKSVWEAFTNRVEKAPVSYKLISNTYKFPVVKPKRNSYDWYIPKGILKRNWMVKHLNEVPAVIIIFYDLDWNDSLWNEKMIECASRVQSMKIALEGRDTRIVVVLIQSQPPLPDDPLAAERAITLCSSCELNSQSLYVLPHGQHIMGYTIRLENTFLEFAQSYYYNNLKNIKAHKEHLNKTSHQYLFVRHQFKMAYLSELRQDIHTAHKHYATAYNNLLDIRIVDTNALEIRTVACFINYKICRLMFILNLPRDAIAHFKVHIDKFRNKMGFQELTFEHYAWLSKQFEVFGDIFYEAVKLGLPAVQTQHPGIYYQQAAQYAILRKKSCHEFCAKSMAYPYPDPLTNFDKVEFFGQRPWRPGKLSGEPPDPAVETSGIQAIQFLENQINHSSLIISLFGLANEQFKIYKCPRTRRHLVLQMADECYNSKDFGKALTLYTHMLSDYREEKWWSIISHVLEKALRCAYLTANVQDYVVLVIELLGSFVTISFEEKRKIYENFMRILKKQIPYSDPKLPHDIIQDAIILWQPVFAKNFLELSVDIDRKITCVEIKARFLKSNYEVDQMVALEIYVRCTCPFPLKFIHISVNITTTDSTSEFGVKNVNDNSLLFLSNEVKKFYIEFEPDMNSIDKEIKIECINLSIGDPGKCLVHLKFNSIEVSNEDSELNYFKLCKNVLDFDNLKPSLTALIVPRQSKISVKCEHEPPALVGECYEINIVIVNEEQSNIKDLIVELGLEDDTKMEIYKSSLMRKEKIPLILDTPQQLKVGAKLSSVIFVRIHVDGIRTLQLKITYALDTEKPVLSVKNETVILPVVQPFTVSTRYMSTMMNEIHKFYAHEDFAVLALLHFLSPWPIFIEDTSLDFLLPVKALEENTKSQIAGLTFYKEEIANEFYLAVCEKSSDQNVTVGEYTIKWKRQNGKTTTTQVTLYGYHCDWIPLNLKMTAPAHGFVRTPVIVSYHLINHSSHLVQLNLGMEANDEEAVMFAGYTEFGVSVLPNSVKTVQYNLYPLTGGCIMLPKFTLKIPEGSTEGPALRQDQLNQLVDRSISRHLYVMPQTKGNVK
ncbi:trafficking protein particle complex subunit 11 [Cylas formicarius]|uniref:trafficking protein particle complex subunit 11 n=1 Tax=Cylas formicarius TaxID=197179 RepID=UPI002958B96C|nr:trafficking protein particle complex subunit 11 [Cylas formicarius]